MNKNKLVSEIIGICKYFKILENDLDNTFIEKRIKENLSDVIFVENLLVIFYQKSRLKRFSKNFDKQQLKRILSELEIIRLNLELKDINKST